MALALQRNQKAISTAKSLGAARATMSWGHGGSVIIQMGLGRPRTWGGQTVKHFSSPRVIAVSQAILLDYCAAILQQKEFFGSR